MKTLKYNELTTTEKEELEESIINGGLFKGEEATTFAFEVVELDYFKDNSGSQWTDTRDWYTLTPTIELSASYRTFRVDGVIIECEEVRENTYPKSKDQGRDDEEDIAFHFDKSNWQDIRCEFVNLVY